MCHHPGRSVGRAGVCALWGSVGGGVGWTLELLLQDSPRYSIGVYLKIVYQKKVVQHCSQTVHVVVIAQL